MHYRVNKIENAESKTYNYNILICILTDFSMNVARQAKIRHIKFLVTSTIKSGQDQKREELVRRG
jgi:hypothetical protein